MLPSFSIFLASKIVLSKNTFLILAIYKFLSVFCFIYFILSNSLCMLVDLTLNPSPKEREAASYFY
jgi:hypothetical protein